MAVCNADIANLLPNFIPVRTRCRDRRNLTQHPIRASRHNESTEEVQIVDVGGARRHRLPNRSNETDNVDEDTADVGCVAAPVEAEGEVVGGAFLGAVQVFDLVVAFADDVVVADHDTGDGGEEYRVGAEVRGEVVGG